MPEFIYNEKADLYLADIAGFNDTGGDTIEFTNLFIIKEIFRMAKTVKFIVPITYTQIMENRGASLRKLIETIIYICKSSNEDLLDSI